MLSFNDAIHSPEPTISCDVCHEVILTSQAHWYEAPEVPVATPSCCTDWTTCSCALCTFHMCKCTDTICLCIQITVACDDSQPVVPVCFSCHMNPTEWLPSASSVNSGYLQSRDCERLDGPRDW